MHGNDTVVLFVVFLFLTVEGEAVHHLPHVVRAYATLFLFHCGDARLVGDTFEFRARVPRSDARQIPEIELTLYFQLAEILRKDLLTVFFGGRNDGKLTVKPPRTHERVAKAADIVAGSDDQHPVIFRELVQFLQEDLAGIIVVFHEIVAAAAGKFVKFVQ